MTKFEKLIKSQFPFTKASVDILFDAIVKTHPIIAFGYDEGSKKGFWENYSFEGENISATEVTRITTEILKKDLLDEVFVVVKAWYDKWTKLFEESGITSLAPSKEIQPNMPPPEDIKYWEEKAAEQAIKTGKIREKQKEQVKEWEKKISAKKIKEEPTQEEIPETVFVSAKEGTTPQKISLNKDQQDMFQTLKNDLENKGKEKFSEKIATEIEKNLQKEISKKERADFPVEDIKTFSQIVAEDFSQKLDSLPKEIPTVLFVDRNEEIAALAGDELLNFIKEPETKEAITNAVDSIIKTQNQLSKTFAETLTPVVGTSGGILYSPIDKEEASEKFEVKAKKPDKYSADVQIKKLRSAANNVYTINKFLEKQGLSAKRENIWSLAIALEDFQGTLKRRLMGAGTEGIGTPMVSADVGNFLKSRFGIIFSSREIEGQTQILLNLGKGKYLDLTKIAGKAGTVAGKVSSKVQAFLTDTTLKSKAIKASIAKGVSAGIVKIGVKLGLKGTIAAALGSLAPIIGHIIGWIAGELLWRLAVWAKRHWKVFAALTMLAGLMMNLPGLILLGAGMFLLGIGPMAAVGAAAAGFTVGIGILTSIITTIAVGVVVAIISIPILVAFILFIINSGAYVYPPVPPLDIVAPPKKESLYIGIEKKVQPEKTANISGELEVKYTIRIWPKQDPITINSINNEYGVFSKSNPPAPLTPPGTFDPFIGQKITTEITISYSLKLDSKYNDSVVSDTITVNATTDSGITDDASASASLIIGNPPTDCLMFIDVGSWPKDKIDNAMQGALNLSSDHAPFMARVCAKGEINIHYNNSDPGYWGHYDGANNITLYQGGLGNTLNAEYIIAHELGHVLAAYSMPSIYVEYNDDPGVKKEVDSQGICSYPGGSKNDYSESFAEAIAVYASEKPFTCFNGSFQNKYPENYRFMDTRIFH